MRHFSLPHRLWFMLACFVLAIPLLFQANLRVSLVSAAPPAVLSLPYRVIDAEYSASLERIVMVSSNPSRLSIYNPTTNTSVSVNLPRVPLNVSVSPDGHFAAVGHDALISYVDLQQGTLVKTLDVSAQAADIVLAGNGKVYVSPVSSQWVQLHAVDISTNTETLHTGPSINGSTVYKLHPDGQSLYGADRNISPDDIEKINIATNPPTYLYDSPYHGDYPMGGELWMSEDGQRIFTACGRVFRASTVRAQDMTYNGSLTSIGIGSVVHLTHSQTAGKVLVIPGSHDYSGGCYGQTTLPDTKVAVVTYDSLTLDRMVDLPAFTVGQQSYAAHGKFVFANAAGTQFYSIVQADSASGLLNDYGVVVHAMQPTTPTPTATTITTTTPTATMTATPPSTPTLPTSTPQANANQISLIPYRVIDAEYSASLDRIVMVSDGPSRLSIYNPATNTSVNVALPRVPLNVSVSPDGHFAAVGHNALISYVDLQQGTLVKTLNVSAEAADTVLAGNGKVYVSPAYDQWVQLHAVDISTNTETISTGTSIYAGTQYKLHPDGQSLYGANRGLSPSDIEKINIATNPPTYLYDSPYHGEYAMCGNVWMSEDGKRIFTACGNVFRASTVRAQDMTYNGSLHGAGVNFVHHLVHSQAANQVIALPELCDDISICEGQLSDNKVVILSYDNLTLDHYVDLPTFKVGQQSYSGHGRFVFANKAGTEFYTIVQADGSSGLLNDYGVVTNMLSRPEPTVTSTPTPTGASSTHTPTTTSTPAVGGTSETSTPTQTSTPTASVPSITSTPTTTRTPSSGSNVFFESNFATGAPGSVFIMTAGGFPNNANVAVALRRPNEAAYQNVITLPVDANGKLIFMFITKPGDAPGTYWLRLTVQATGLHASAVTGTGDTTQELALVLSGNAEQHQELPSQLVPQVNSAVQTNVYLPYLGR